MKIAKLAFAAVAVGTAAVSFKVGTATGTGAPFWRPPSSRAVPVPGTPVRLASANRSAARTMPLDAADAVIENYCKDCHNEQLLMGNVSFDGFQVGKAESRRALAEKAVKKLRTEMM